MDDVARNGTDEREYFSPHPFQRFVLVSGELRGITVSDTEQGRAFVVQKPIAEFMRRFSWALSRVIG
jgi:hypothetical protein